MKILIINWRSVKDPLEGGAERATFEFAKRWVKKYNCEVFWLSPNHSKDIHEETIEGVKFDYIGLPLTRNVIRLLFVFPLFYLKVFFRYFLNYRGKIDIVIDQVHGIPFLTPFYVKEKKVVYMHEVAGEIWKIMYPFPIKSIGYFIEEILLKIYRVLKIKFIVNSESTENDLISKIGVPKENIKIIYYGVSAPKTEFSSLPKKEKNLQLVYLNRIVKMKGIERGLRVFELVHKKIPDSKFVIIGKGEDKYIDKIKELINTLDIANKIKFVGFIDGYKKFEILGKSHLLINPSYLEGFGLVNIEANRMGTPAIVFNVRGCKDSVKDGISGKISPDDDIENMAENITKNYQSKKLRKSSWEYSNKFDWENQADIFLKELERIVGHE